MRSIRYIYVVFLVAIMTACQGYNSDPKSYDVWGIDISKHQHGVDWELMMREEAPDFVFLKATEGTLIVDPTYADRSKELDSLGILHGAYHFFGHRTMGEDQAKAFIATAKLKKGDMFPVLDIEWHRFMKDPKQSVREAKAFCKVIKDYYGVNPIIYCSTNFYHEYLERDFSPEEYPLWIADYRGVPDGILGWHFWQHTQSYKLKGVRSLVDRNVFRGDLKELQKFVL